MKPEQLPFGNTAEDCRNSRGHQSFWSSSSSLIPIPKRGAGFANELDAGRPHSSWRLLVAGQLVSMIPGALSVTTVELIDVAALLALRARSLGNGRLLLPARPLVLSLRAVDALDASWRQRIDETNRDYLSMPASRPWATRTEFEEMLVCELLLRTWTAFIYLGQAREAGEPQPHRVAAAITTMILHQRRRVLLAILKSPALSNCQSRLDRTRRIIERWTDVLLSGLPNSPAVRLLRFDDERSADYAEMWSSQPVDCTGSDSLVIAAMRAAIPAIPIVDRGRCSALRDLLKAILGCLGEDAFDQSGMLKSRRQRLIERCGLDEYLNWPTQPEWPQS